MKSKNSIGVKILKSILIFLSLAVIAVLIMNPLFSIFGPLVRALPFETPNNYIVADYVGIIIMFLFGLIVLRLTCKWGWR